jgi:hypothetical protein
MLYNLKGYNYNVGGGIGGNDISDSDGGNVSYFW